MSDLSELKDSLRAFLNVNPEYIYSFRELFVNPEYIYSFRELLEMDADDINKNSNYPTFCGLYGREIGSLLDKLEMLEQKGNK
jgi:hypothetical protein